VVRTIGELELKFEQDVWAGRLWDEFGESMFVATVLYVWFVVCFEFVCFATFLCGFVGARFFSSTDLYGRFIFRWLLVAIRWNLLQKDSTTNQTFHYRPASVK
jgi:hypothetical protein